WAPLRSAANCLASSGAVTVTPGLDSTSTISQGLRSPLTTSDDLPRTLTLEPGETLSQGLVSLSTQRTPSTSPATSKLMYEYGAPNGSGRTLSIVPVISMTLPAYLALAALASFLKLARHWAGITTRSALPSLLPFSPAASLRALTAPAPRSRQQTSTATNRRT